MTLSEFINEQQAAKKKIPSDIIERWQERIVRHGWQNQGEAGVLSYFQAGYANNIAAPKCINFARCAEGEGYPAHAMGWWKKAYELAGNILAPADAIKTTPTGQRDSTIAPAQKVTIRATDKSIDDLPARLQPGHIITMQPVDAPDGTSRLTYINSDRWLGMPKRNGERCVVIATPTKVWYQSRSLKLRLPPNGIIDATLKEAAAKFGSFIFDNEEEWYDVVGGEHITGAQAQKTNDDLGRPEVMPRGCLCIFKALYTTQDGDLLDAYEIERLKAREKIGQWLVEQAPEHFELVPVARTTAEKQTLCDKQVLEEREGEVWLRTDTKYIGGKVKAEKSTIVRTKYQIEFMAVITDLTSSNNASYPFGAIVISRLPEMKPVGMIGTGYDRETMHRIAKAHAAAPGTVVIKAHTQRWSERDQVHHGVFDELVG